MASLGQSQVKEALAAGDPIKQMMAMSDDELMALTGMKKQLQAMKDSLVEADGLQGKARTEFNKKLEERLTPRIDGYDFNWMIKDAKRAADPKKNTDSGSCC